MNYSPLSWQQCIGSAHRFANFTKCNEFLIDNSYEASLVKYIEITSGIPLETGSEEHLRLFDLYNSLWLKDWMVYLISTSSREGPQFCIPLSDLTLLGVDMNDYRSKLARIFPLVFRNRDSTLAREERLIKRFHLKHSIDVRENRIVMGDQTVTTGYNITHKALYRVVRLMYGPLILEMLTQRVSQITYFYDQYREVIYERKMSMLRTCVREMNTDIENLRIEVADANIGHRSTYDPHGSEDSYADSIDSYPSTPPSNERMSIDTYPSTLRSSEVLTTREFTNEISHIHDTIETNLVQVDGGITRLNSKLVSITSKIDDIVDSMALPDRVSTISAPCNQTMRSPQKCRPYTYYPGQSDSISHDSRSEENAPVGSINQLTTKSPSLAMLQLVNDSSFARYTCIGL